MTSKAKMQDRRTWERMGRELTALRDMMGHIITDPEYQAVMDRQTWNKLCIAQSRVDAVRSEAEGRMALYIPDWTTDTFYPRNREKLEAAIEAFRNSMREEATQ